MTYVEHITDAEYGELQRRYGGQVVARRGAEVIASAESYEKLSAQIESAVLDWTEVIIEYVEPVDRICAY